ncbi:hypothetical protein HK098_006151 [Nowakowskiella sp. JEL0407]|nr:hypothetical protein HK098_006151 [Nowakowskiella sp. JEL0407]
MSCDTHLMIKSNVPKSLVEVIGKSLVNCCENECDHENPVKDLVERLTKSHLGPIPYRAETNGSDGVGVEDLLTTCIGVCDSVAKMNWPLNPEFEESSVQTKAGPISVCRFSEKQTLEISTASILRCNPRELSGSPLISTMIVRCLVNGETKLLREILSHSKLEFDAGNKNFQPTRTEAGKAMFQLRELSRFFTATKGIKIIVDAHTILYKLYAYFKSKESGVKGLTIPSSASLLTADFILATSRLVQFAKILPAKGFSIPSLSSYYKPAKIYPTSTELDTLMQDCGTSFSQLDAPFLAMFALRGFLNGDLNSLTKLRSYVGMVDLSQASSEEVVIFLRCIALWKREGLLLFETHLMLIVRAILASRKLSASITVVVPSDKDGDSSTPSLSNVLDETVVNVVCNELLFFGAQIGDAPLVRALLSGLLDLARKEHGADLEPNQLVQRVKQFKSTNAGAKIHRNVKVALNCENYECAMEFVKYGFSLYGANSDTLIKLSGITNDETIGDDDESSEEIKEKKLPERIVPRHDVDSCLSVFMDLICQNSAPYEETELNFNLPNAARAIFEKALEQNMADWSTGYLLFSRSVKKKSSPRFIKLLSDKLIEKFAYFYPLKGEERALDVVASGKWKNIVENLSDLAFAEGTSGLVVVKAFCDWWREKLISSRKNRKEEECINKADIVFSEFFGNKGWRFIHNSLTTDLLAGYMELGIGSYSTKSLCEVCEKSKLDELVDAAANWFEVTADGEYIQIADVKVGISEGWETNDGKLVTKLVERLRDRDDTTSHGEKMILKRKGDLLFNPVTLIKNYKRNKHS